MASIWHREEFSVPGSPRNSSWPRTREGTGTPYVHALTGCDTASSFAGHGKKTARTIWTVLPELTNALLKLFSAPSGIPDDVMHTIERSVILLYDRTSTCKEINKARKKIFAKKNNAQLIPPTKAALEEHVKRAAKCKKRCVKRCKFKKAALECTALCVCEGGVLTNLREHKQSRLCH